MKFAEEYGKVIENVVAPFAGAWIEIKLPEQMRQKLIVAPFAGAWIEMGRRYSE